MLHGLGFPSGGLLQLKPLAGIQPSLTSGPLAHADRFDGPQKPAGPVLDWKKAGHHLAQVGARHGYARDAILRDKAVIREVLREASRLYGVPYRFLEVIATRESGMQQFSKDGRVKQGAAVGMFQVEKSAHGNAVNGAVNVYDLYNNVAYGASQLAASMRRMQKESNYRGGQPWQDLGPIVVMEYGAGIGTRKLAQQYARQQGLDPYNWKQLIIGANGSTKGTPMYLALEHMGRKKHFPFAYTGPKLVKRFDLDGDGVAHRSETQLHRIQQCLGERP